MSSTNSRFEREDEVSGTRSAAPAEDLLPLVYTELRKLAQSRMAHERQCHTLQPTALVHEAYLRLLREDRGVWANKAQFFAAAAEAMRRILIDRARRSGRHKRGGDRRRITLVENALAAYWPKVEILALDQALHRLEQRDAEMAEVVKLRAYAGLTVQETASVLEISARTVKRRWTAGRVWLYRELSKSSN